MLDNVATSGRRETDTDPEEPVECRSQMTPAVPAEDESVEVALDVLELWPKVGDAAIRRL